MNNPASETVPQVLIEIRAGTKRNITDISQQVGRDRATVFRWMTRGAKTPSGDVIKLEAVRIGSTWMSSDEAVTRFVVALTEASNPSPAPTPKTRTPSARQKAIDAANKRLAAAHA